MRGIAARILLDARHSSSEETSGRMSYALSRGESPESAAAWLEGFLNSSGMVLVHDEALFRIVHEWVTSLSSEHFTQVLPLIRRTFSTFPPMERRQIGERINRAQAGGNPSAVASPPGFEWDEERAVKLMPVLRRIFNLKNS